MARDASQVLAMPDLIAQLASSHNSIVPAAVREAAFDADHFLGSVRKTWATLDIPGSFEAAKTYAAGMHARPFDYYSERVKALQLGGGRLLDAGCGTGTWSFAFAPLFDEVHGVDKNEPRIELAKWLNANFAAPHVHFSCGDVLELDFPDNYFDIVFCYGVVISYIPLAVVLREFHRVLRPGGKLLVCLNGIGWSKYLRDIRSKDGDKYLQMGLRGIYNTICQRELASMRESLVALQVLMKSGNPLAAIVPAKSGLDVAAVEDYLKQLRKSKSFEAGAVPVFDGAVVGPTTAGAREFLTGMAPIVAATGGSCDLAVIERIQAECGETFVLQLADDVLQLARGSKSSFSHGNADRGYEPDEVETICSSVGLFDFHWAHEGGLGSGANLEAIYEEDYLCSLRAWEFIATKVDPDQISQETKVRADVVRDDQASSTTFT